MREPIAKKRVKGTTGLSATKSCRKTVVVFRLSDSPLLAKLGVVALARSQSIVDHRAEGIRRLPQKIQTCPWHPVEQLASILLRSPRCWRVSLVKAHLPVSQFDSDSNMQGSSATILQQGCPVLGWLLYQGTLNLKGKRVPFRVRVSK